jgi:dTDP-4-dehydrorhamnose 3,5-epimerase
MRKNSKDFLKIKTFILDEKKNQILTIPKGFAHGFQTLKDNTEILYFHNGYYKKKYESGLNPFDKKVKIKWPLKISKISEKDKRIKFIDKEFAGLK